MTTLTLSPLNETIANAATLRHFDTSFLKDLILSHTTNTKQEMNNLNNQFRRRNITQSARFLSALLLQKESSLISENTPSFLSKEESDTIINSIKYHIINSYPNKFLILQSKLIVDDTNINGEIDQQIINKSKASLVSNAQSTKIKNFKYIAYHETFDKIQLLFKHNEKIATKKNPDYKKNVFFILSFDFSKNILEIRYNNQDISSSNIPGPSGIIKVLKEDFLQKIKESFIIQQITKENVERGLFSIYQKEKDRVVELLDKKSPFKKSDDTLKQLRKIWKQHLQIDKIPQETETLLNEHFEAIHYLTTAQKLDESDFGDRYISQFTFTDKLSTRSSTRNKENLTVYKERLYWILKPLVQENKSLQSLSLCLKRRQQENTLEIETTISSLLQTLEISYANGRSDYERGDKHEELIKNVLKHIPEFEFPRKLRES